MRPPSAPSARGAVAFSPLDVFGVQDLSVYLRDRVVGANGFDNKAGGRARATKPPGSRGPRVEVQDPTPPLERRHVTVTGYDHLRLRGDPQRGRYVSHHDAYATQLEFGPQGEGPGPGSQVTIAPYRGHGRDGPQLLQQSFGTDIAGMDDVVAPLQYRLHPGRELPVGVGYHPDDDQLIFLEEVFVEKVVTQIVPSG